VQKSAEFVAAPDLAEAEGVKTRIPRRTGVLTPFTVKTKTRSRVNVGSTSSHAVTFG
jgi:hypothetical protein